MLRLITGAIERQKARTQVLNYAGENLQRLCVVGTATDFSHVQQCLDSIATFRMAPEVVVLLDELPDTLDLADVKRDYSDILLSVSNLSDGSGSQYDGLILLHPFPHLTEESHQTLRSLRSRSSAIRCGKKYILHRDLTLWRGSFAVRIQRALLNRILEILLPMAEALEDFILESEILPRIPSALALQQQTPCPHLHRRRVFSYPRPTDFCPDCAMGISPQGRTRGVNWMEKTYGESYALHGRFTGQREWRRYCQSECDRLERNLQSLGFSFDAHSSRIAPPNVLDVGCGYGRYAQVWVERGWQYVGVDPSRHNIRFAEEDAKQWAAGYENAPEWICGTTEDTTVAGKAPFEAIVLCQVLEHVPEPQVLLRQLHNLSSSQGRLYVEVPNALSQTWSRLRGYTNTEHLWDFTNSMLIAMIREAGWNVLHSIEPSELNENLSVLAEWMPTSA